MGDCVSGFINYLHRIKYKHLNFLLSSSVLEINCYVMGLSMQTIRLCINLVTLDTQRIHITLARCIFTATLPL